MPKPPPTWHAVNPTNSAKIASTLLMMLPSRCSDHALGTERAPARFRGPPRAPAIARGGRNHVGAAMFPDQGMTLRRGGDMRKALTIAVLVVALAACRAHGGF